MEKGEEHMQRTHAPMSEIAMVKEDDNQLELQARSETSESMFDILAITAKHIASSVIASVAIYSKAIENQPSEISHDSGSRFVKLQPAEGEKLRTDDVTLMFLAHCEVLALHLAHLNGPDRFRLDEVELLIKSMHINIVSHGNGH
ncbi:unnamed protein product [Sphenostylis stenocarpa]|uniref:Uncharacterized protein n=1 Tax=Sphenostylis stenocarpa TaxID=92480 RepID=A0AA86SFA2_9FABA|nr:unnamed protein product [Sphenostylis stenocarpa]